MQPFRFQRFFVIQKNSGMKICTDATLFGAMAPVTANDRVLDIGTGTGLLALMAAQLGAAEVIGVELTAEGYAEAKQNFRNSPWAERLRVLHGDIRDAALASLGRFDLVISNPPFFEQHTRTSDALRNTARHTDSLSHRELIDCAISHLQPCGLFYLLLPSHAVNAFLGVSAEYGLHLIYRCEFRGHQHRPANVCALTLGFEPIPAGERTLTIYQSERNYSAESCHYLGDFLLRFAKASAQETIPGSG